MVKFDRKSSTPMYRQIYLSIREDIMSEKLHSTDKLPAIRDLASSLGVARNTIEAAYRQLLIEGFVTAKRGVGYVVEDLDYDLVRQVCNAHEASADGHAATHAPDSEGSYSDGISAITDRNPLGDNFGCTYDFSYGNRSADLLPLDIMRSLATEVLTPQNAQDGAIYIDTLGLPALRKQLAKQLAKTRDVHCAPDQIILTSGTEPALRSITELFEPGVRVAMEEPGYPHARSVFARCKANLTSIPTDKGADNFVERLRTSNADVAFLTPSNQFPFGYILPFAARLKIIAWAQDNESYLIEDDYCCEYRYGSSPIPSLQSLDPSHVIYLGTMSKVLTPAIRLSYIVLPPALLERWRETHRGRFCSISFLPQAILARFMENEEQWTRYTRTTINLYRKRHQILMDAIERHLGDHVEVLGADAGLHLLIGDKRHRSQAELIELARAQDVRVYETSRYWSNPLHPMDNFVLIGFSSIPDEVIDEGIRRLARAWYAD